MPETTHETVQRNAPPSLDKKNGEREGDKETGKHQQKAHCLLWLEVNQGLPKQDCCPPNVPWETNLLSQLKKIPRDSRQQQGAYLSLNHRAASFTHPYLAKNVAKSTNWSLRSQTPSKVHSLKSAQDKRKTSESHLIPRRSSL